MPYSYPIGDPVAKHDVSSPQSFSPEASLRQAEELLLTTTSSFFLPLQEPPTNLKLLSFVYSYNDVAKEPLSRNLSILGFADLSMSVVRKLVGDDEGGVPDCLHRRTLSVRRGDQEYMKRLEEKHRKNSSWFAYFMYRLRKDNMVAILAKDKLDRFALIKPIDPIGSDKYNKEDFFCSCFVGNISEVKKFLMGDPTSRCKPFFSAGGSGWDITEEASGNQDRKRKREDKEDEESGFHADAGAAAAAAFYGDRTSNVQIRVDSELCHMRAFNNWVKATQIQELDPNTKGSGKEMRGPLRILDLACGKGGDLGKWIMHSRGVKNYVGSDVALGSLKDAAIRARRMRHRGLNQCTFTCADLGHDVPGRFRSPKEKLLQKLCTWSLQGELEHVSATPKFKKVRGGGIHPNEMFDVVSIQFAIHYMISTQERARRLFHTVSQLLEVGGNLIATTIDARVIIGHLMNLGADLHSHDNDKLNNVREPLEIKVGCGACRIRFEPEIVATIFKSEPNSNGSFEHLFCLEYTFTLVEGSDHKAGVRDAVNLPEWLVPLPMLETLGKQVGLELEYAQNFHEFFKNRQDPAVHATAHHSLHRMNVLNHYGSISQDEWDISRLYCAVKFRTVHEPQV